MHFSGDHINKHNFHFMYRLILTFKVRLQIKLLDCFTAKFTTHRFRSMFKQTRHIMQESIVLKSLHLIICSYLLKNPTKIILIYLSIKMKENRLLTMR